MSIAAFYRNWIPFVQEWVWRESGEDVVGVTDPVWVKGNIQPFKEGLNLTLEEYGTVQQDFKTLYTRSMPVFDEDSVNIPPSAQDAEPINTWFYWDGEWYAAFGYEDWRTPARAPKHIKWTARTSTAAAPPDWPVPIPFASLVQNFEQAVWELEQLTPVVYEEIV